MMGSLQMQQTGELSEHIVFAQLLLAAYSRGFLSKAPTC